MASHPYKTSSALLTLPAGASGVSVTPAAVSEDWSAWVELSAEAATAMRIAAIVAYPGVRANGNFYEAELGVGSAGNEVTVGAVRGYSGDPNGGPADANDLIELPIPADVVSAGDRLAVRLRQVSTTTTAWRFSIQYWALPIATGTHMPASTVGPVNVPSGSRVSVTSGASSSTYGSWVEVTAATDADWSLGNLTYFGPDSASWTLEIGVGAAGSEVTIATLRGTQLAFFGGFQGGPYNILLRPLLAVASGSRLALRIKSATTVTAFPFGLTVVKALVNGAYTDAALNVYPDVTLASAAGGPTVFTPWTTVIDPTATDVAIVGLFKTSPQGGLMGTNIIQLAIGSAGSEVMFAEYFTSTAVWGGGQFNFPLAIAQRVRAGERVSIRYSSEAVGSGVNITFGVYYHELSAVPDFDNWTDDLIQDVYLNANNAYAFTSGGSAWVSGSWAEIDAATAEARVITAWHWTSAEPFIEFEVDVGTGGAGSEVVAFTLRVGYGSTEGTLAHRILPIPQIIAAGSRLSVRGRSSHGSAVSLGVALHYTDEPVTATSNRNLLTGENHTVDGSDNLIAGSGNSVTGRYSEAHGQVMDVTGTRAVGFSLDGGPHALNQDGILALYGDLLVTGEVTLEDIAAPAATTYGVTVDEAGVLASAAIAPAGITQLTGDVTAGPGSGSQAATIANDAVTYAKMQETAAASVLIGRGDSSAGNPQEITIGSGLSMSGTTLSVSTAGGWIEGLMRGLGDGAETVFLLPDVAESLLFASVNGLLSDPLTYTLTGSDDEVTFDVAPGAGEVITVNYVTASA